MRPLASVRLAGGVKGQKLAVRVYDSQVDAQRDAVGPAVVIQVVNGTFKSITTIRP